MLICNPNLIKKSIIYADFILMTEGNLFHQIAQQNLLVEKISKKGKKYMLDNTIEEFRKNYIEVFHSQVKPKLIEFEKERKEIETNYRKKIKGKFRIIYIIAFITMIISGILLNFVGIFNIIFWISVIIFFSAVFPSTKTEDMINNEVMPEVMNRTDLNIKSKNKLMPIIMSAFEGFQWTRNPIINDIELNSAKIFPNYNNIYVDDNFTGSYKGISLRISEIKMLLDKKLVFNGIVIALDIPKKFKGQTIVKSKKMDNLDSNFKEVKLESNEFADMVHSYSNDQIEARYLLTPAFIERYLNIYKTFGGDTISCSFFDNKLILAISKSVDFFEIWDKSGSITNTSQYERFLEEIITILKFVEALKLFKNTGL